MIFKTLWSLHNELIWLGLPNYTDHISLPLHVQILTANGFLCCCALCPVMPIFCFFVCHHVKTEVWPHISCNQTLLYYRFCRLAFLAPQLQKSGKIAIRVFGGLTDTVLHLNAHLNFRCFLSTLKSHFSDGLWNWFWPFLEPKLSDNFMVIKPIKLTHLNSPHHHFVILTYKKVKQLLDPRLFITLFNSEEGRTQASITVHKKRSYEMKGVSMTPLLTS